jgi:hypothetical protein
MRTFTRNLAWVVTASCGSVTTYQSAETLPPGRWQGGVALDLGTYNDREQQTNVPAATAELSLRRGVAAHTDVGIKLYGVGVEASVRQRLVAGAWSWALLGSVGGVRLPERVGLSESLNAQLRIGAVITRRTSAHVAWSFGPTTTTSLFMPAGGGHATGVMLGAFGSIDVRFGRRYHFVPELSLHRTLTGDVPVSGSVGMLGSALVIDL